MRHAEVINSNDDRVQHLLKGGGSALRHFSSVGSEALHLLFAQLKLNGSAMHDDVALQSRPSI
jgi:hypothetical protein